MARFSLGKKLIIGGLVLVLVPLLVIGIFSLIWTSSSMERQAGDNLESMRNVVVEQVDQILKTQADTLGNAAKHDAVIVGIVDSIAGSGVYELADFKLATSSTIFHDPQTYEFFLITNDKGVVVGDTVKGIYKTKDLSGEGYYQKALQKTTLVGDVGISEKTSTPYVAIASALVNKANNNVIGVAVAGWRLSLLNEKMSRLRVGKNGYVIIADRFGRLIVHPDKNLLMKTTVNKIKGMEKVGEEMLRGAKGVKTVKMETGEKIVSFGAIPQAQWSLALMQPRSEIQAPILLMRAILLTAVFVLSLLVGVLIAWIVRREINKPIHLIVQELEQGAQEVAEAAEQMSETSKTLADHSSTQASALEESSSALEEMSSMTKQSASNARQADSLMEEANSVVDKVGQSMGKLTQAMADITRSSDETSRIIKTIDEIAFQTNLLALNAAVEAARAGEAGAGFAVVADEVRNLSLRAAEAARNTTALIESTVKTIQQGASVVKDAGTGFSEVAVRTGKVGGLLREIARAADEQARGIEQINKAVADMDKTVQQNAAGAEEAATASQEIMTQSEKVKDIVFKLVSMVDAAQKESIDDRKLLPVIAGK